MVAEVSTMSEQFDLLVFENHTLCYRQFRDGAPLLVHKEFCVNFHGQIQTSVTKQLLNSSWVGTVEDQVARKSMSRAVQSNRFDDFTIAVRRRH